MEDFVEIDLGIDGKPLAAKNNLVALIDADTLAYTACLATEQQECIMERDLYTEEEYKELLNNENYDEANNCIWTNNIELAYSKALDKLDKILGKTGCQTCELHFTGGRDNFRYKVLPDYKANRIGMRAPTGLRELKAKLLENFEGTISTSWEADDIVVCKKMNEPNKYIMVAVDKDLLYSVEGCHFNYYESSKYNIDMKFQTVDANTAMRWAYIQCLIGDTIDNIKGIKGIGPKKAEKIFAGCSTHADYWYAVVNAFEEDGKGLMEAIETMRLVNMYQLEIVDNEYVIKLWKPEDMR